MRTLLTTFAVLLVAVAAFGFFVWALLGATSEQKAVLWHITEERHPRDVGVPVRPYKPGRGPTYLEPDRVMLILPTGESHLIEPDLAQVWQTEDGEIRSLKFLMHGTFAEENAVRIKAAMKQWGCWSVENQDKVDRWLRLATSHRNGDINKSHNMVRLEPSVVNGLLRSIIIYNATGEGRYTYSVGVGLQEPPPKPKGWWQMTEAE